MWRGMGPAAEVEGTNMELMLDHFLHMQIPARDLEQSIAWYSEHLGFHSHRRGPGTARFSALARRS